MESIKTDPERFQTRFDECLKKIIDSNVGKGANQDLTRYFEVCLFIYKSAQTIKGLP